MTPPGWAAAILIASATHAEAPPLLPWHGNWVGEGRAFGNPATAMLDIAASEDGATRLVYRLTIAGMPSASYLAEVSYAFDVRGRLRGKWTDSHGRTRPVAGGVDGSQWWTNWGSADVEIGRSTYVLESDGELVVSDSILEKDGRWRLFAMLRYRRTNP